MPVTAIGTASKPGGSGVRGIIVTGSGLDGRFAAEVVIVAGRSATVAGWSKSPGCVAGLVGLWPAGCWIVGT